MPRRGQYAAVAEAPERVEPVPARIGVRRATSRPGRTLPSRSTGIDPGEFRCSRLVGELADEWVQWARLERPDPSSLSGVRTSLVNFAAFVDANATDPTRLSLADESAAVADLMREWRRKLPAGYPVGSTSPWRMDRYVTRLIAQRAGREDTVTGTALRALVAGATTVRMGKNKELDEFSRAEKNALVRAAWAGLRSVEARLEHGRSMLSAGGDLSLLGWQDPANLLWLLDRGATAEELGAVVGPAKSWPGPLLELTGDVTGRRGNYPTRMLVSALADLLYPRLEDMHAIRVLLVAATGMVDEIAGLEEGDVEFSGSHVSLSLAKGRAHRERRRRYADAGPISVVEVMGRLLAVSERARTRSGSPRVFTYAKVTRFGELRFLPGVFTNTGRPFSGWARECGLELSEPVDLRRLRKARNVEKIIAQRGDIRAAADDHTVETMLGHYVSGTTVKVIAGQIAVEAQGEWLERALSGPQVLDAASAERLTEPEVFEPLGLSAQAAAQVAAGELNMGVADCKDPYNAPHGSAGQLCAVAPLHCLECRHALILPSNLPQLLLYGDHVEAMRERMAPPVFHAVWGQRRANLHAALDARSRVEIEAARHQIAEASLALQLPLSSHTEFDL